MASHYLGPSIDLHAGGEDLVFPHHESERAQIEPLTGQPFARHWLHIAPVQHLGQKMSKSLGNLVMVRDLLNRFSPDALRLYLAGHHYRKPWAFDQGALAAAEAEAEALAKAVELSPSDGPPLPTGDWVSGFTGAIENDLNTPAAREGLRQFGEAIERGRARGIAVGRAQGQLRELAGVFGLRLGGPAAEARVSEGWRRHLIRFRAEPVR
jgi:cysteinyl-tRNA synthetase